MINTLRVVGRSVIDLPQLLLMATLVTTVRFDAEIGISLLHAKLL
jgi:hypothetical protein